MYFYELLTQNRYLLNETENALLDYLLEKSSAIREVTIREVAERHYTAPNTIVRMCQKLGFKGFSDFKEGLYYAKKEQENLFEATSLDEKIVRTKQLLNASVIETIIDKIHHAEKILFFAVGLSRFPAEELNERLKILGKNSQTFIDPHVMKHNARLLSNKDLVIAISLSGTTENILSAATIASVSGAETVSITGFSMNPLANMTNHQLYANVSVTKVNGIDLADRFSIHYLVNVIFTEYLKKYPVEQKDSSSETGV